MWHSALVLLFALITLSGCRQEPQAYQEKEIPPLISAAESGDLPSLTRLLQDEQPADIRDACHWTPLMKAALNGHLQAVKQLLAAGASVNLTDKGGYSALMLAASNNHAGLVEYLIHQGAAIDQVENTGGWTALIWSAKQGHLETVKTLLQYMADTEHHDLQDKRALDWAIEAQHEAIVKLIGEAS